MGQLRDKKIIQSRSWLDPNPDPIPTFDYDYIYPISVYEAIKRNMDDDATNLSDELESIYHLINEKQNIVEAGTPGNIMTWTGVRGSIGSIEVLKSITSDPSLRSHQKILSERAVGDLIDGRVPMNTFNSHIMDNSIHVTDVERSRWNSMAPMNSLNSHISNIGVHITEAERGRWNNKADQTIVDEHNYNINNPHKVTAHQVGSYTRQEIDNMFETLRESFFNYLNIYWDELKHIATLVEYHANHWNPNYILKYEDELPEVANDEATYFALKPATDYHVNESQDCIIYIKQPGKAWEEVGFQTMTPGDMVIKYPDTSMYVWVQGRFMSLFNNGNISDGSSDGTTGGESDMMWRPVINDETGELTWTRSRELNAPDPIIIKGKDAHNPIKGIDYFDGKDGEGVPIGGLTGELLVKMSEDNYDTTWRNIADIIADLVISGEGLPAGIIKWDMITGRPEWYNELGDNENGFITQRAVTRQFENVNNSITELMEKIIGAGGIDSIKEDLYNHANDYANPHRVTPGQIGAVPVSTFTEHTQNFHNPHNVTANQIGLGNVNNTSDMDKPISNAVQEALDELVEQIRLITGDVDGINYIDTVTWREVDTTLTFIYKDGNELDIKIPITDIFTNIHFDSEEGELVIVLPDGNENRIDISSMIKTYTGTMSKNVQVEVEAGNVIKATVLPNSICEDELKPSIHLIGSPTTTTQPVTDKSTRIATTEFVRGQVVDNLISYETDRALSANMGRILNQRKVDVDDIIEILNDIEAIDVVDNLDSTNPVAALSANMGRFLDLTKAPRVHTSSSASTFGVATVSLFGHTRASNSDPQMDGTVFRGTDDGHYARGDHRHPTDSSRAPAHFPDVVNGITELTGEPKAVTPPDQSNNTRIATTEWIRRNAIGVTNGYCTTVGNEPNKVATLNSTYMDPVIFMRQIGSTVAITFDESDYSGSENTTLNVQNSGAATIIFAGAPVTSGMIGKNHTHMFVFDGTNWRLINPVPGTGIGGPEGITLGPGIPGDTRVVNRMAGHNGITVNVGDNSDEHGNVDTVWVTLNYAPKAGGVEVTISEAEDAWAIRMGDGSLINVINPVVIETTSSNAVIQFTMETSYPANSPCQLVYRTNESWINIKEL